MDDATEMKVNGAAGNQRNSAGSQLVLLFTVLVPLASSFGQTTKIDTPSVPLMVVVQSMEEAQSDIQLPRHVTREYRLRSPARLNRDSGLVAHVDFTPPGRYAIERRSGSNRAEQVVRQLLQHEIETAMSMQRSKETAITTENYDFSFLRKEVFERTPLLSLTDKPKAQAIRTDIRAGMD